MTTLDRMFRAFADETRLRIIHLLMKGELCVCDLMSVLREPQSKISRHLGYLRGADLVKDRRDGHWRYYSLTAPTGSFHKRLLSCVGGCFDETPLLRRDAVGLRRLAKARCNSSPRAR